METKICRTCGQEKSQDEFSSTLRIRTKVPSHLSFSLDCKPCASKRSYATQKENWDRVKAYRATEEYKRSQKDGWLRLTYHKSIEWFEAQFDRQGGVCGVCGKPEHRKGRGGEVKALAVDHDHRCCSGHLSCGKCVRGLVCEGCNHTLGFAQDSIEVLAAAILYLKSFKKENENAERIDHP